MENITAMKCSSYVTFDKSLHISLLSTVQQPF